MIERHRITTSQFVPTMFVRMLKLPDEVRERYDVSSLTHATHAAAPCPVDVKQRMLDWWGPIIHEFYAGTEGAGICYISPTEWFAATGVGGASDRRHHPRGRRERRRAPGPDEEGQIYFDSASRVRVPQRPRKDRRDAATLKGLAHPGRHRPGGRGRLSLSHRPQSVHHQLRRGEHLPPGSRERHSSMHPSPWPTWRCSVCPTRSSVKRSKPSCSRPEPVTSPEERGGRTRSRAHRVLPVEAGRASSAPAASSSATSSPASPPASS